MEDLIQWIDLYIDGFEPIKSIPIELGGVWSYELVPDDLNKIPGLIEIQKKGKKVKKTLSIIVNVWSDDNCKIVSIESPLLFSNNTEFNIDLITLPDAPERDINEGEFDNWFMTKFRVIQNSVFIVPITWLI